MKNSIALFLLFAVNFAAARYRVAEVDLLGTKGLAINAVGPALVKADAERNRVIVANSMSSSVSIIDGASRKVQNIPTEARFLQHLKAEALTVDIQSGAAYLIADKALVAVYPDENSAVTVGTDVQFESVAFDPKTGKAFFCGRESEEIAVWDGRTDDFERIAWRDSSAKLLNQNQTPPPPIRKVITAGLGKILAVDGYEGKIFIIDAESEKIESEKSVPLEKGGRWHLAGFDAETGYLYIVTETLKREVIQAGAVSTRDDNHIVIDLPKYREGVGMVYNPARKEVYVNYDNNASTHVVDFSRGGELDEIAIPTFGNDAAALDSENDLLYVGSWARGEVDVIDLENRRLVKRITDLGIIPHMFAMDFNSANGKIYFPLGASAVNGNFGAAVTELDPETEETQKIDLGWAPIDIIELPKRNSVLVFNNEDEFAEIRPDGDFDLYELPYEFPVVASPAPVGDVYLSYGPHQSYWPTVYIWGAKNGVLRIDGENSDDWNAKGFYDRRIPRQAMQIALDTSGALLLQQNNWGREEQFVGKLIDGVRLLEIGRRLKIRDTVQRETTQRLMRYDPEYDRLYLAKVAEDDFDPGKLQIVDLENDSLLLNADIGVNPTDMLFDEDNIYVCSPGSQAIYIVDKETFEIREEKTGVYPLKIAKLRNKIYAIDHIERTLHSYDLDRDLSETYLPAGFDGAPDNVFVWDEELFMTCRTDDKFELVKFEPESRKFEVVHRFDYPYGDARFDSNNSAFYLTGQFADAVYALSDPLVDKDSRLWLTDFLSGKILIVKKQ